MGNNTLQQTKLSPLIWAVIATISAGSTWYLLKHRAPPPLPLLNCKSRLAIDIGKPNSPIRFRTDTRYIIYDNMSGVKSDVGTMQVGEQTYLLNRNYYFRYRNVQHSVEVTVTDVIKKPSDNAPDSYALLSPNELITYHFTLENLRNGAYMLKLIDVPFVLCGLH